MSNEDLEEGLEDCSVCGAGGHSITMETVSKGEWNVLFWRRCSYCSNEGPIAESWELADELWNKREGSVTQQFYESYQGGST